MRNKNANMLAEKGKKIIQINKTGGKEAYKNTVFSVVTSPGFLVSEKQKL